MKKGLKKIGYSIFIIVVTVLLFELSFRIQLIDFYKNELTALNPSLKKGEKSILIFGDSFTAHINSYVSFLRQPNPEINFINTAIAGSGIRQHELFCKQRVKEYKPQHIVYQFYVGNDFLDIKHPLNYDSISLLRNIYWLISDQLLGIHYLNFRLAYLRANNQKTELVRNNKFSSSLYNQREKLQFVANPNYLENSINLKGNELDLYAIWKEKLKHLISKIDQGISITLLIIPHCAQVNTTYQNRMETIGAVFNTDMQKVNYPLIERMRADFPEIQIIDPLEYFQHEEDNYTKLYYENDPHLTIEGHKIIAKILREKLNLNTTIPQ